MSTMNPQAEGTTPGRRYAALMVWEHPLWSALLAGAIYLLVATVAFGGFPLRTTSSPYYNYLADALLHGQLHLRIEPPTTLDLSVYDGRLYPYWPPFPAVLFAPLIALWGVRLNDFVLSIAAGSANVALIALLLRRASVAGIAPLAPGQRALLVLFFALGTVHATLAPYGGVWFTGQLVGFGCVALAYLAAIGTRGILSWLLVGLALGCAFLTRNPLVLAGVWPLCFLLLRDRSSGSGALLARCLAGAAPAAAAVALYAAYNYARFDDPLETGYRYHQMSSMFRADYEQYGAFNLVYLPTNVYYQYLAYPLPLRPSTPMGGSLFLLSPLFAAAVWALVYGRPRWSVLALGVSVALVATPILLLMGTGYKQFGPRYTLDFTVPLLLLTAIGIRRWPIWLTGTLVGVSVLQYLTGALLMVRVLRM